MITIQRIIDNNLKTFTYDKGNEVEYIPRDKSWDKFTHTNEYFPNNIKLFTLDEKDIITADLTYWLLDITTHYFSCGCGYEENHKLIFEEYLSSYNLLKFLSKNVFIPNNQRRYAMNSQWNNILIEGHNGCYLPEKLIAFIKRNSNEWVQNFLISNFKNQL